jgi:dipeptidyl aminopeptidase/acylaminoacyl peptidase
MPMIPRRLTAALFALTLALPALAHAGTRPWTIDDLLSLNQVSDPQVNGDATWVAYVVQSWNSDRSGYQSDLWVSKVFGEDRRQFTFADGNDDTPRWSPDGRWLAFLSDRPRPGVADPGEGRRQVWRLRADGGEAQVVTELPGGVLAYEWAGDGDTLVVLGTEPTSDERRKREKDKDDAWRAEERLRYGRLWTVDVATRKATPLTTTLEVTGFSVSPDGRQVAFAGQATPRLPDLFRSDLYRVAIEGGTVTPLVTRPGADFEPAWSPDGKWIAFFGQDSSDVEWYSNTGVYVVAPTGGAARCLTPTLDESPGFLEQPLRWNHSSTAVAFLSDRGPARQIVFAYLDGREPEPFTRGDVVCGPPTFDRKDALAVFVRESSTDPRDVYFQLIGGADSRRFVGSEPRPITHENPQADAFLTFHKDRVTWKGTDGLDIDGLLIYPTDYRPGQRAPLLMVIHGGPSGTHSYTCSVHSRVYPYSLLAQHGWAVLLPNPRGSEGYGRAFRAANVRDWGGKDYDDLMAGVDAMISRGIADPQRLAVAGWSYGGFMTSTIVTKTDRFKAAVVGAGVTDEASMTLTCDIPDFSRSYFGAWPWEDPQFYVDHSAVYHAGKVKTPTAFIHGEADDRVPPSQAWEFYNALRLRGVPTDLLMLPRSGHGPREPKLLKAAMQWHLDWLERWTPGFTPAAASPATRPAAKPAPARPAARGK